MSDLGEGGQPRTGVGEDQFESDVRAGGKELRRGERDAPIAHDDRTGCAGVGCVRQQETAADNVEARADVGGPGTDLIVRGQSRLGEVASLEFQRVQRFELAEDRRDGIRGIPRVTGVVRRHHVVRDDCSVFNAVVLALVRVHSRFRPTPWRSLSCSFCRAGLRDTLGRRN